MQHLINASLIIDSIAIPGYTINALIMWCQPVPPNIALFKRQLDRYWEQIGYGFEQRPST